MKKLRKHLYIFILAVLAGAAISIGGCVFLILDNRLVGALMFTVGLYAVCVHGLNLYTGKVGYVVNESLSYCLELAVIWLGNLAGTCLSALAISTTRIAPVFPRAVKLCEIKVNDSLIGLFLLGIFCGFLMFVAVDGYKTTKNPIILFMGVAVFILCGFEHCIADMFYFSMANMWSARTVLCILVITLGNSLGGMLIPLAKKCRPADEG